MYPRQLLRRDAALKLAIGLAIGLGLGLLTQSSEVALPVVGQTSQYLAGGVVLLVGGVGYWLLPESANCGCGSDRGRDGECGCSDCGC